MYEGAIKGFPPEVVERMLLEQEIQGNKRNIKVFEKNYGAIKSAGGFNWSETIGNAVFWEKVVIQKDFAHFFKHYPKPVYPKIMEVSDYLNFSNSKRRVVFMEKKGKFLTWSCAETFEEAEDTMSIYVWAYARDIKEPEIKTITLDEAIKIISEKLDHPVDYIRINL